MTVREHLEPLEQSLTRLHCQQFSAFGAMLRNCEINRVSFLALFFFILVNFFAEKGQNMVWCNSWKHLSNMSYVGSRYLVIGSAAPGDTFALERGAAECSSFVWLSTIFNFWLTFCLGDSSSTFTPMYTIQATPVEWLKKPSTSKHRYM